MRHAFALTLVGVAVALGTACDAARGGASTAEDDVTGDAAAPLALGELCRLDDGDRPGRPVEVDTETPCADDTTDVAHPLFTSDVGELPEEYAALHALCGRLDPAEGTRDERTNEDRAHEIRAFFRSLLGRPALARALAGVGDDPEARLDALERAWLAGGGFEHVLCGEVTAKNRVGGLHLWSELYFAEREGRADYRCRRGPADPAVLAVRFAWRAPGADEPALKPYGSMVPGMSPACLVAVGYAALTARAPDAWGKGGTFTADAYGATRTWVLSVEEGAIYSVYPNALDADAGAGARSDDAGADDPEADAAAR